MSLPSDAGQRDRRMTVVHVRDKGAGVEVMFVESARIYRLARGNPVYAQVLAALHASAASGRPASVRFDEPDGEIIEWAGDVR